MVQTEHDHMKTTRIKSAVTTRWNSRHSETVCANINQFDIDLAIRRMVCVGGVDEQLYIDCNQKNDFTSAYVDEDQWSVYQQYHCKRIVSKLLVK